MLVDCTCAPVGGEWSIVPLSAEAGLVHIGRPAAGAPAVIAEWCDALFGEVLEQAWVAVVVEAGEVMEAHIPAATVVGVVAGEDVHLWTDRDLQNVASAGGVNLKAAAIRPHANHTAAAVLKCPAISALGLHESEVAARDVEPAVHSQAEAVGGVIGWTLVVAEGDILHEDVLLLGNAIVVRVDELTQMRRVHEVEAVVVPDQAAWRIDFAENLGLIGTTIAIEITQTDHATTLRIAT